MPQKSEWPFLAGLVVLAGAAVSAELAWLHARSIQALGVICGQGPDPHCAWCPTALVLLALGLFLVAAPSPACAPSKRGRKA